MAPVQTLQKRTVLNPAWRDARRNRIAAAATLGLLLLLAFFCVEQLQPPSVVPATAPAGEFSAARALDHLKVIAQKPHPTGSAENAAVRAYLLDELSKMGFDPQIQISPVIRYEAKWRGPAVAATVYNVMARLKGTKNTKAVVLVAHYDSVTSGPGASDDGSGVATLLETARALKSGPPLANDVIFLFTDGEETGMLGAQAFLNHHPWAKDAGVVLNFEARGACGPVTMFETSAQNGRLIAELAKAAPHALTSSLMFEIYKLLPNDTDLTVFKQAGLPGLNFAYVGCWPRYHTMGDTVRNLDPRSLQHDGSYALALARGFGNADLSGLVAPDAVYFSLFGATIHYSEKWALALLLVVLVLFVSVMLLGLNKRRLRPRAIVWGFLLWPMAAFASSLLPEILWVLMRRTRLVSILPYGMAYNGELYATGFLALAVSIFCAIYFWASRKCAISDLTAGALAWWALLAALASFFAPGASYVLEWPLLFALLALGYEMILNGPPSDPVRAFLWALPAAAVILIFGQVPYLLLQLLSTSGLVPLTIVTALLLGVLLPNLHVVASPMKWVLPAAWLLLSIALVAAAIAEAGYNPRHPRADTVFYLQDSETGKALWASTDRAPDSWTAQFFAQSNEKMNLRRFLPFDARVMTSSAPFENLDPPEVTALDDVTLGNERFLRLAISSPRQARVLWVSVPSGQVLEGTVDGIPVPRDPMLAEQGMWGLVYVGLPSDGITLVLHLKASQPLTVRVTDQSDGLPEGMGGVFTSRPADFMPAPGPFDSTTLVSKTFAFKSHPEGG